MNTQMKRVVAVSAFAIGLMVVSSDAFAFGRSKHSGYRGWSNSTSNSGGNNSGSNSAVTTGDVLPGGDSDSNPVPEPTSMLMLGSALAGFGGYRGLRKRFLNK